MDRNKLQQDNCNVLGHSHLQRRDNERKLRYHAVDADGGVAHSGDVPYDVLPAWRETERFE